MLALLRLRKGVLLRAEPEVAQGRAHRDAGRSAGCPGLPELPQLPLQASLARFHPPKTTMVYFVSLRLSQSNLSLAVLRRVGKPGRLLSAESDGRGGSRLHSDVEKLWATGNCHLMAKRASAASCACRVVPDSMPKQLQAGLGAFVEWLMPLNIDAAVGFDCQPTQQGSQVLASKPLSLAKASRHWETPGSGSLSALVQRLWARLVPVSIVATDCGP